MTTSVVIAEDSFLVREGMRHLLAEADELAVVAVCADYRDLLAAVEGHRPDVVITDVRMPPSGTDEGIRAAREIRARWPGTGVVILSQYAEPADVLALFEGGADGIAYLLKQRLGDLDQLLRAIDQVRRNRSLVDPRVVEVLVSARAAKNESLLDRLTPRELDVLGQLAEGKTNAAIARDLRLSRRAVEKHSNAIFAKLDLGFDADANRRVRAVLLWLAERSV